MEKDRSFRTLAVIAVIIAVTGVSVAFASLTQALNINGQTKLTGSKWKVEYAQDSLQKNLGGKAIENIPPEITLTNFIFDVSFFLPGDSVTYKFDVVNNGTIDAILSNEPLLLGVPGEYANDINFTLTYAGGASIKVNDGLLVGEKRTLELTVTFKETADTVPEEDLIMKLSASLLYVQK